MNQDHRTGADGGFHVPRYKQGSVSNPQPGRQQRSPSDGSVVSGAVVNQQHRHEQDQQQSQQQRHPQHSPQQRPYQNPHLQQQQQQQQQQHQQHPHHPHPHHPHHQQHQQHQQQQQQHLQHQQQQEQQQQQQQYNPNHSHLSRSHSTISQDVRSRRTSTQDLRRLSQENAAATAVVQQEMNNVQALKRLSIGALSSLDPDLPAGYSFDPSSVGIDSSASSSPPQNTGQSPSSSSDHQNGVGSSSPDRASRDLSSTQISPSQASQLLWVPANVHPELAPQEWKSFVQKKVAEIKAGVEKQSRPSSRRVSSGPSTVGQQGSTILPERSKSTPTSALSRRNSRLSRQIKTQDDYTDGSEILGRRISDGSAHTSISEKPDPASLQSISSLSQHLSTLGELESLAADPFQLARSLSGSKGYHSPQSSASSISSMGYNSSLSPSNDSTNLLYSNEPAQDIALANDSDEPILPGASGSLRRATRNRYNKASQKGRRERPNFRIDVKQTHLENVVAEGPNSKSNIEHASEIAHQHPVPNSNRFEIPHAAADHQGATAPELSPISPLSPIKLEGEEEHSPPLSSTPPTPPAKSPILPSSPTPPPVPPKSPQTTVQTEQGVAKSKSRKGSWRWFQRDESSSKDSSSTVTQASYSEPAYKEATGISSPIVSGGIPARHFNSSPAATSQGQSQAQQPQQTAQQQQQQQPPPQQQLAQSQHQQYYQHVDQKQGQSTPSLNNAGQVDLSPQQDANHYPQSPSPTEEKTGKESATKSISSFFSKMIKKDSNGSSHNASDGGGVNLTPTTSSSSSSAAVKKSPEKSKRKPIKSHSRYRSRSKDIKTTPTTIGQQVVEIEKKRRSKQLDATAASNQKGYFMPIQGQQQAGGPQQQPSATSQAEYIQQQQQQQQEVQVQTADIQLPYDIPPHQMSDKSLVMMYHRYPIHIERAIYRLSHLKLANPRRPLVQQVLLSNFMYAYLNLLNHGYRLQQQQLMFEQQQQQYGYEYDDGSGHYDGQMQYDNQGVYDAQGQYGSAAATANGYDNVNPYETGNPYDYYETYEDEGTDPQNAKKSPSAESSSSSSSGSSMGDDMWTGDDDEQNVSAYSGRHRRGHHNAVYGGALSIENR